MKATQIITQPPTKDEDELGSDTRRGSSAYKIKQCNINAIYIIYIYISIKIVIKAVEPTNNIYIKASLI